VRYALLAALLAALFLAFSLIRERRPSTTPRHRR
jgi:hypothetical protein